MRWTGRPFLFALAVMNAVTGIGLAVAIAPDTFGGDSGQFRTCALLLAEGGKFCGSLYSPLFNFVARPLTWVSPTGAMVGMALLEGVILAAGVVLETRGRPVIDRVLVGIAVLGFWPVVYELLLGQTTLLICVALYPVVRRPDAAWSGIPLGLALALAPKPMLVPVLTWMLVWRRRALATSVVTALVLTALAAAVIGTDEYRAWLDTLSGAGRQSAAGTFNLSQRGNFSLWPLSPITALTAALVTVAAAWEILRSRDRGFVAALLAGLLLAPYSGLYAFSILLLGAKQAFEFAPRATRALALSANLASAPLHLLTAWSVIGLGACLSLRPRDEPAPTIPRP